MTNERGSGESVTRHVYVHVPFCTRRCSYCDFSIAVRREVPAAEFVESVLAELRIRARGGLGRLPGTPSDGSDPVPGNHDAFGQPGHVETIYFGGGTPSKLGPAGVAELITGLASLGVRAGPDTEVTLEANPEDVDATAAAAWLRAGVNRLSIGIQSFATEALEWMHRTHSADQSAAAVRAAREAGFRDVSMDLIYALPARLERSWLDDVNRAIDLGPDHLSVYGLTVEPHTPLGRWTARGAETPQTDDRAAEEFLAAHRRLEAAGYQHYEVSNYARPGKRSRHNSAYWRRVPYLGLGPSAHSFDGSVRRWNVAAYTAWQQTLARAEDPRAGDEQLDASQENAELLYLALRTDAGAALQSSENLQRAARWASQGWAVLDGSHVRLTPEGWLRLDALVGELI